MSDPRSNLWWIVIAASLIGLSTLSNVWRTKSILEDEGVQSDGVDAYILHKKQRFNMAEDGEVEQCFDISPQEVRDLYAQHEIKLSWFGKFVSTQAPLCEGVKNVPQ